MNRQLCATPRTVESWHDIDFKAAEDCVKKLQMRIAKAVKEKKWGKVKSLQWTLTHSFYAKALAIKRVTENKGKRTSGVDHEIWESPESKFKAIGKLSRRGYRAQPLRRIYIKKKNGKLRPLSIPIGTNLYLAKIALDIKAKHAKDFIAELDEEAYCRELWDHKPITDFWRISTGTAERLRRHGITTLRQITQAGPDLCYHIFGIDGELLYDHAWGRESTTIKDIKNYRSKSKSLSSGQVLMKDYNSKEAEIVTKEMMDRLCLDMTAKHLATSSVSLYVGYSHTEGIPGTGGTAKLTTTTNTATILLPAIETLYRRIVNPSYVIRRICISCNDVVADVGVLQLSMFEDISKQIKSHSIQEAMLGIQAKYGRNAILKGMNFAPGATGRERNLQIGGHKANG